MKSFYVIPGPRDRITLSRVAVFINSNSFTQLSILLPACESMATQTFCIFYTHPQYRACSCKWPRSFTTCSLHSQPVSITHSLHSVSSGSPTHTHTRMHTCVQKLLQHALIPHYITIQHTQQTVFLTSLKCNAMIWCGVHVFPLLDVTPSPDNCFSTSPVWRE